VHFGEHTCVVAWPGSWTAAILVLRHRCGEGMPEALTILRLGVPPTLARTLHSTNPVESMIEICREHSKNVKRWRDGTMALRWCAAGMLEADHQFRRVNGHLHVLKLRAALDAHFTKNVRADCQDETVNAA
jgi:putative transposase